jgi:GDP-L-fucose synthase
MLGSALVRRLEKEDCDIVSVGRTTLDLRRQQQVEDWVAVNKPDVVFVAAARVGGIMANSTYPADFLYDNTAIAMNVIEAARRADVAKLVFLGSSCIYPRLAAQPISEDALLTGPLEPTNEWYAVAKIDGMKLAEAYRRQFGCDFISAMPTNLYGPGDNFDPMGSHVLPAMLLKAHTAKLARAKEMTIWGSGSPRREFLHVDDCADALVFLSKHYSGNRHVNVGMGNDITILELGRLVADVVGFQGDIRTDVSKPDGMMRKLLDSSLLNGLGWKPRIGLQEGIASTYSWFLEHEHALRRD